jgi:hypothetical protein
MVTLLLQNECRLAEIWDWKIISSLLLPLVALVLLYGCDVWGLSLSKSNWNQVEWKSTLCRPSTDEKHNYSPQIMLAETGLYPFEMEAIRFILFYSILF